MGFFFILVFRIWVFRNFVVEARKGGIEKLGVFFSLFPLSHPSLHALRSTLYTSSHKSFSSWEGKEQERGGEERKLRGKGGLDIRRKQPYHQEIQIQIRSETQTATPDFFFGKIENKNIFIFLYR